jgi:diguanylate cyclase (GGDEF)-like protein
MNDAACPPTETEIRLFSGNEPDLERAWQLSCTGRVDAALALAQRVYDEAATTDRVSVRAAAACHLSWYCFMQGHYEEGLLRALSASEFYSASANQVGEAWARSLYAWLLMEIGSAHEALEESLRAIALVEGAQEKRILCFALNVVGVVFWMLGQLDRARDFAERAVRLAREIGDETDLARWLINLAEIEADIWSEQRSQAASDPNLLSRVLAHGEEALRLTRQTGDSWAQRLAIAHLTRYHLLNGDAAQAARILAQAEQVEGGTGLRSRVVYLFSLGQVQMAEGNARAAIDTLTACATLCTEISDIETSVLCCEQLSQAWSMVGDFAEALRWHRVFHERYVRKSENSVQIRARVASIQYETRHLQARVEAERSRADGLEEMNRALAEEATQLMSASMEDVLTGLPNRRGLERALLAISVEGRRNYSLAMIDIDHFKQINDRFSHALGDEVLRQVAHVLRLASGAGDRLFRYGGEEFVLLTDEGDEIQAAETCLRICQVVRKWDWTRIDARLSVTISIGLACAAEAETVVEVMAIADARLYQAKNAGRDGVVHGGRSQARQSLTVSPRLH